MIQPINNVSTSRCVSFKNNVGADVGNLEKTVLQADSFESKISQSDVKSNKELYVRVAAGLALMATPIAALLLLPKVLSKVSKTREKSVSNTFNKFQSLKDDSSIPTLDTCNSINPKLKTFLQNQVCYTQASKEDLIKSGTPQSANRLIMFGPPGSGKSFFSKIFAKTLDAEYMEVNYADINRQFVGEHNENLKNIFADIICNAKERPEQKFVVNFNEIDAIMMCIDSAKESGGGHVSSKKEERSIFLDELEKLRLQAPNVVFIGSTNASAKGQLDGAALSRFKNIIEVGYPDQKSIFEALKANIRTIPEGENFIKNNEKHLDNLALQMSDRVASFRDLENVVNESKHMYLRDLVKDKESSYQMKYLEDALKALNYTDGEISGTKKTVS